MPKICLKADCNEIASVGGYCREHVDRKEVEGKLKARRRTLMPLSHRFFEKVDTGPHPLGCHLWTGATTAKGYGAIRSTTGHTVNAHRVAFELETGIAPGDLFVAHLCDVRNCVNPAHLCLMNNRGNLDDMLWKRGLKRDAAARDQVRNYPGKPKMRDAQPHEGLPGSELDELDRDDDRSTS